MSAHLNWMIIRNNSSFLLKGSKQNMSMEKNNLKGRNSFRYNGLVHNKTVGVVSGSDDKGVALVLKKTRATNRPAKAHRSIQLKKDSRVVIRAVRQQLREGGYRPELTDAAVKRASAILKSQKPKEAKQKAAGRRRE